jgi:hypothetical protein
VYIYVSLTCVLNFTIVLNFSVEISKKMRPAKILLALFCTTSAMSDAEIAAGIDQNASFED